MIVGVGAGEPPCSSPGLSESEGGAHVTPKGAESPKGAPMLLPLPLRLGRGLSKRGQGQRKGGPHHAAHGTLDCLIHPWIVFALQPGAGRPIQGGGEGAWNSH